MRIDAYTHFFPKKFFDKMNEVAGDYKDMGKRVRSLPALYDLDYRKKIVDGHKDYQQILSYPQPPVETFAKTPAQIDELDPDHQRRLRGIVRQGEATIFPAGWRRSRSTRPTPAWPRRSAPSRARRARRADLHQRRRQAARPPAIPAVLEEDERARQAGLAASGARRQHAGLYRREEIALRDLVDVRLVLRDRDRDGAPGVLQDHGQPSQSQDHHPPFRRHRADAGRPHRSGLGRAGVAHHATRTTSRCARA